MESEIMSFVDQVEGHIHDLVSEARKCHPGELSLASVGFVVVAD